VLQLRDARLIKTEFTFCRIDTALTFWLRDSGLVPMLIRDADLTLLIVAFIWRHLRNADSMSFAFMSLRRDASLVSLRRDADLALLIITPVMWSLRSTSFSISVFWYLDADFTRLTQFKRDASLSFASYICRIDGFSSFFHMLLMCAMPLSTFNILVTLHGLLGTPGNLGLRKKRGMTRFAFNDVGFADPVRDVDADHATKNGVVCAGHL